jgi:hypothetical protein
MQTVRIVLATVALALAMVMANTAASITYVVGTCRSR